MESVDEKVDEDAEAPRAEEIARCLKEADSGKVATLPWAEVGRQSETSALEAPAAMRTPWTAGSAGTTFVLWILTVVGPPPALGQTRPDLEVIEDQEAVAASRREYERIRGLSTGEARATGRDAQKPAGLPWGFPRGLDTAAVQRLLAEAPEEIRLQAAGLLLDLDGLRGRETLFGLLDSRSPEIRAKALESLSSNLGLEHLLWFPPEPEVRRRLLALLDDPDPGVRRAAFDPCSFLSGPGVSERLHKTIRQGPADERAWLAWCLAWRADAPACLDAVLEQVGTRDAVTRGWVVESLATIAARADGPIAQRAGSELEKLLLEDLRAGQWTLPYPLRFAAPGLAAPLRAMLRADPGTDRAPSEPPTRERPEDERPAADRSAPDRPASDRPATGRQAGDRPDGELWTGERQRAELARIQRSRILETLGQVDTDAGDLLLRTVLEGDRPEDVGGALRGLLHAKGAPPDTVVRAVLARSSKAPSRGRLDDASVQLLLSRGGASGRRALLDRFDLLDGYWRCAVLWALHGWDAMDAAREIHAAGLGRRLPRPDPIALRRLRHESLECPREAGSELAFLCSIVRWMGFIAHVGYDEMGETPVGYDGFIEDIVRETGSDLPVDAVWQTLEPASEADPGIYRIRFAVGTRLYCLSVRGDEANATAFDLLLAALNAAAAREGRRERFIPFLGFDPHECVYADPAIVHAVRMRFFLPAGLKDDRLDAEYRQHVARTVEELKARLPASPGGS